MSYDTTISDTMIVLARTLQGTKAHATEARLWVRGILDGEPRALDMEQAIAELLSNAVVHTDSRLPGGQVIVAVEDHGHSIVLHVADMGGVLTSVIPPQFKTVDQVPLFNERGRGRAIVAKLADAFNFGTSPCEEVHDDLGGICCRALFTITDSRITNPGGAA